MNKLIKPIFSMLFLSMIAFLIKIVTTPKGEISSLRQMKQQTEIIKNSESKFIKEINSSDFSGEYKLSNIGINEIDENIYKINQIVKSYPEVTGNIDKNKFALSVHFLLFEYAMTKHLSDICASYGIDISDYFPLFYENNKNIRNMIMAYMSAKNYINSLKSAVNDVINTSETLQNINLFNERLIKEINYDTGKDVVEICETLPIANLAFGEKFMNKLKYDYFYAKNYKTIVEN